MPANSAGGARDQDVLAFKAHENNFLRVLDVVFGVSHHDDGRAFLHSLTVLVDDPALEDRSIMQTHLSCVLFSN